MNKQFLRDYDQIIKTKEEILKVLQQKQNLFIIHLKINLTFFM